MNGIWKGFKLLFIQVLNKTKLKILDGAKQVFVENSFYGTALDKLLGSIKVSKGSFFHHFRSKDELLNELIEADAQIMFDKFDDIFDHTSNPVTALNNFLNWRLENYKSTGRLIYKLGYESGTDNILLQKKLKKIFGEYLSTLIKIIDEAKNQNLLVQTTPTKELATFILYGIEGASMSISLIDSSNQYAQVIEMIKKVIRGYRVLD